MRATSLVLALLLAACGGGGSGGQAVPVHYTAADFQTVQDFLDNPIVQEMLSRAGITIHTGSTPPLIEGVYETNETIIINDIPPHGTGAVAPYDSTYFDQSADTIMVDDADTVAQTYITGSGSDFTLWAVFAIDITGFRCTAVEVDVASGSVLPSGDIDARFGAVIVGISGPDCGIVASAVSGGSVDAMRGLVIASTADLTFLSPPP